MLHNIEVNGENYTWDDDLPLDISIPLKFNEQGPNCFYAPWAEAAPVIAGDFVGDTTKGGAVNFKNVKLNPHGNGTHTECVGHISKASYYVNECLKKYVFLARVISVWPEKQDNGDRVITMQSLEGAMAVDEANQAEALIVRTLPNKEDKCWRNYSGTNPVYFSEESIRYIVDKGFNHLLVDLPSVDREEDGGALKAHKAFWQYPENVRKDCTITELIFVNEQIQDGLFLLHLQIAPFQLDASPSKPTVYQLDRQVK